MPGNFKNKSVDASRHAMVPRADVPRSMFKVSSSHKTAFNCGRLVPIYVDEVLPGDSHSVRLTAFCRLGTVLFPIMDNLHLETFFFFVPNRLVWDNWVKLMGERANPTDSIAFTLPQITSPANGWAIGSLMDYFGLPTVGQVDAGLTVGCTSLPLRAYYLIYEEWFRDQNLQLSQFAIGTGDGPDASAYGTNVPLSRCKRPDYFTTCLPWPQKPQAFGTSVWMDTGPAPYGPGAPGINVLQVGAPVSGIGALNQNVGTGGGSSYFETGSMAAVPYGLAKAFYDPAADNQIFARVDANAQLDISVTINAIRQAFQIQRLLERDARGGTRYTEKLRSHFGVEPQDSRLQRPEYLGGGSSPVQISPIAQQSGTGASGTTTPLGHLSATATGVAQGHGFSQSFSEHGWIIGIASVRADLNYYHGVHKMWHRNSQFDFYFPVFAQLGEQAVMNREIFMDGSASDLGVFGFQERWSEYRSKPGIITGVFRGNATGTLDAWHLAERFANAPALNATFIGDPSFSVVQRVLAAGAAADGQQVLFDGFFDIRRVRPIPTFSTPGLVDHF